MLSTEMAQTPPPRRGGVGPGHVSPGQTPLHTYTSRTDAVRHGAVQRRIWRFAGTRTGTRQQLVGTLPPTLDGHAGTLLMLAFLACPMLANQHF